MQPSDLHHRKRQATAFVRRTSRDFNIPPPDSSNFGIRMVNQPAMAFGAGPLYTNAIMGQGPSAAEREHARKASSTIFREDSILVEESENVSRPDSWSLHFDCTDQPPYSNTEKEDLESRTEKNPAESSNCTYELSHFLRSTGPVPPHRQPSKIENPSRATARRKKAIRFLKLGQQSGRIGSGLERDQYVIFERICGGELNLTGHALNSEMLDACWNWRSSISSQSRKGTSRRSL